MSSRTRSTSSITDAGPRHTVVIALGSNLGDRAWNLRRALQALRGTVSLVRVSSMYANAAVDAPEGSPPFLNQVVVGYTSLSPEALLTALLAVEKAMGRARGRVRNAPRVIDLDLIVHGAGARRSRSLTLPHPRAARRPFVSIPLAQCGARLDGRALRVSNR